MGVVYLVRHGQASFGTDDYDRLSPLGHHQARISGEHLTSQGVLPTGMVHGEMLRQRQTADGIVAGLDPDLEARVDAGWNEFDAGELVGALPNSDPRATTDSKVFQRVLERACSRWAVGDHDADYTETFSAFTRRVDRALEDVCATMRSGESTVVVSSSGAIAWTAAKLIGGGFDQWLRLNRVTVNAAVTKIITGARGTSLISFNDHGHLPLDQVTYR